MARLLVERRENAVMGVANLMSEVRKIADRSPTGQVWFRGIRDVATQGLMPSIGRRHWFAGKSMDFDAESEQHLFRRFRRMARQFEGRLVDEWEAMFLARHHGLPVRLLDWTENPLVALYMACEHDGSAELPNGCIWVLVPRDNRAGQLDVLDTAQNPFQIPGVRLIDPIVVSPRISLQGGIFTIHGDPWKSLEDFEDMDTDDEDLDIAELIGFQILGRHKPLRLKELKDLGITRRTLFPDYDGLARGLVSEAILHSHASELNSAIRAPTPEDDRNVRWNR